MATGTVYVDYRSKDEYGRVLSFGRLLVGANATINPADMQMRTVRGFGATPWFAGPARFIAGSGQLRQAVVTTGSIGSAGVLGTASAATSGPGGAYVRVRTYRLYGTGQGAGAGAGTFRLGTQAGSFRLSYWAVGE